MKAWAAEKKKIPVSGVSIRQRVQSLVLLDAHHRDVQQVLIEDNCFYKDSFEWQSKFRAYAFLTFENNVTVDVSKEEFKPERAHVASSVLSKGSRTNPGGGGGNSGGGGSNRGGGKTLVGSDGKELRVEQIEVPALPAIYDSIAPDQEFLQERLEVKQRILDASFSFGFEYVGNGARLVLTPQTEKVYLATAKALNMCTGCVLAGPAGVGKTREVKNRPNIDGQDQIHRGILRGLRNIW